MFRSPPHRISVQIVLVINLPEDLRTNVDLATCVISPALNYRVMAVVVSGANSGSGEITAVDGIVGVVVGIRVAALDRIDLQEPPQGCDILNRPGFGSVSFGRMDHAPSVSTGVPAACAQDA